MLRNNQEGYFRITNTLADWWVEGIRLFSSMIIGWEIDPPRRCFLDYTEFLETRSS